MNGVRVARRWRSFVCMRGRGLEGLRRRVGCCERSVRSGNCGIDWTLALSSYFYCLLLQLLKGGKRNRKGESTKGKEKSRAAGRVYRAGQ
jgi:hypothetical protein